MYIITTPIPYANAKLHLGHVLEAVFNDTIARYQRRKLMQVEEVSFSMGLDQHGQKIHRKAQELGKDTQEFVDEVSSGVKELWNTLQIQHDDLVETTSPKHKAVAQFIWKRLEKKSFIYKKSYKGLYCVGDEAFVTQAQLREGGLCPNHDEEPIEMNEENYFFKLSQFSDHILEFLRSSDIRPNHYRKEWINFVEDGLEDVSISREKSTMPWGIPVPGDDSQVMYVWFEALINYMTAIIDDETVDSYMEFPLQEEEFGAAIWEDIEKAFPIDMVFMGKDMPRFHLVMWQGMLSALNLPLTKVNIVHGFILDGEGRKMSKSLGNVIDPQVLIDTFGVEGTKFALLFDVNPLDDSNFDLAQSIQNYNSNLADNFGNLVVRVSNLVEKYCDGVIDMDNLDLEEKAGELVGSDLRQIYANLESFNPQLALKALFAESSKINEYLEKTKPWMLAKDLANNKDQIVEILTLSARIVSELGKAMSIFLPESGNKIYEVFAQERIVKSEIIFPKIEVENN